MNEYQYLPRPFSFPTLKMQQLSTDRVLSTSYIVLGTMAPTREHK